MLLKQGTHIVFKILKVYLCDHAHQFEYSKQYSMIESYYRFVFTEAHYPLTLTKQTSSKLLPKIIDVRSSVHGFLFILHILSKVINFSKCTIGNHKNSLIMIIPYQKK